MKQGIYITIMILGCLAGCNHQKVDITPHTVNPKAEILFLQAKALLNRTADADSAHVALSLIDEALHIDSLSPTYYREKARLLAEMGQLGQALEVEEKALSMNAMDGENYLQMGIFQAALGMPDSALINYKISKTYFDEILKAYPDSLYTFVWREIANSLIHGQDSLFFNDLDAIRRRFKNRLLEIETIRHTRPSMLVSTLKQFNNESILNEIALKDTLQKQ